MAWFQVVDFVIVFLLVIVIPFSFFYYEAEDVNEYVLFRELFVWYAIRVWLLLISYANLIFSFESIPLLVKFTCTQRRNGEWFAFRHCIQVYSWISIRYMRRHGYYVLFTQYDGYSSTQTLLGAKHFCQRDSVIPVHQSANIQQTGMHIQPGTIYAQLFSFLPNTWFLLWPSLCYRIVFTGHFPFLSPST